MTLSYDGTDFCGWQSQPEGRSVQDTLEESLRVFLNSESKSEITERISITASGRTDAGVHAKAQVVSFNWPESLTFDAYKFIHSLNGITPNDIAVSSAELLSEKFDARRSAHRKCYRYNLYLSRGRIAMLERFSTHVFHELDLPKMIEAATLFRGTQDFSSFRAADCAAETTVRTIESSEFSRLDQYCLVYSIQGKGFLKQMVRNIVGTLVEVGRGNISLEDLQKIFAAKDRTTAGPTAPAKGLCLEWVRYEEFG